MKKSLLPSFISRLTLLQKGLLIIAIPLFLQSAFIGWITYAVLDGDRISREADRTSEYLAKITELTASQFELALHLATYGLLHTKKAADECDRQIARVDAMNEGLNDLIKANPAQREGLEGMQRFILQGSDLARKFKKQMDEGDPGKLFKKKKGQKKSQSKMEALGLFETALGGLEAMEREARKQQRSLLSDLEGAESRISMSLLPGVGLSVLLALFLVWSYRTNLVVRLQTVVENCKSLASSGTLAEAVSGEDEIAHLDQVFHKMADVLAESARRERAMVEDADDVICSIDTDGVLQTANKATEELLGAKRDEIIGRSMVDFIRADQQSSFKQHLAGQGDTVDLSVQRPDGTSVDTRWAIRKAEDKNVAYCVVRDVSAEKEMAELKQYFVSMVTHDLRSPLMSIQNMLTLMESGVYGEIAPEATALSSQTKVTCQTMVKLISDFLDLEKISAGGLHLNSQPVVLAELVEAVVGKQQAESRFSIKKVDCTIHADRTLLESCLNDLVSTITESIPQDSAEDIEITQEGAVANLTLTCRLPDSLKQPLSLSFQELFSLSEQLMGASFEKVLQLSRTRSIVELHGGQLVLSEEGGKTQIAISLPLQRGES